MDEIRTRHGFSTFHVSARMGRFFVVVCLRRAVFIAPTRMHTKNMNDKPCNNEVITCYKRSVSFRVRGVFANVEIIICIFPNDLRFPRPV